MVLRQETYLPQQVQGWKVLRSPTVKVRMQMAPQKGEEMKVLILILLCLIAFIPKTNWDNLGPEGQNNLIQELSTIYFQKHPGREKAQVVGRESNGMVVIVIDEPSIEL